MNHKEAQRILRALIEGCDPESDEALPPDSVLQRVGVIRALLLAQEALQDNTDRKKRREALPIRVGVTWTTEEDEQLTAEWKSKEPLQRIAETHGRTIRAIESRLEKLKLITAEQRTTVTMFGGSSPAPDGGEPNGGNGRRRGRRRRGSGTVGSVARADRLIAEG